MTNTHTREADAGTSSVRESKSRTVVYRARHDFDGEEELVTTLLMGLEEVSPSDRPAVTVLNDVVDPDSIERIFAPVHSRTDRDDGFLTFPFDNYWVTIHADGEILIEEPARES